MNFENIVFFRLFTVIYNNIHLFNLVDRETAFIMGTATVMMSFTLDQKTFNSKGERERGHYSLSL